MSSLYLHTHHLDEFDFFLIGGGDTYVVVENLRRLLGSKKIRQAAGPLSSQPLYLGRQLDNRLENHVRQERFWCQSALFSC